jgi:hypothetical protein
MEFLPQGIKQVDIFFIKDEIQARPEIHTSLPRRSTIFRISFQKRSQRVWKEFVIIRHKGILDL